MTYVAKNEAQAEAYEMLGVSYVLGSDTEPEVDDSNRRQTTSKMSTPSPSKAKAKKEIVGDLDDIREMLELHGPSTTGSLTKEQLQARITSMNVAVGWLSDVETGLREIGEEQAADSAGRTLEEAQAYTEILRGVLAAFESDNNE